MGNPIMEQSSRDLTFAFNTVPAEARVLYLYRYGYIADIEFTKWLQDNTYEPVIAKLTFSSIGEDIMEHARREEVLENRNTPPMNLDFFE